METIKEEFLDSLARCKVSTSGLRVAVLRAVEAGVARDELLRWAVAAHYTESYARSLLSAALSKSGNRLRKPGGGRRTPPQALAIMDFATNNYGQEAGKYLRAAYRAFRDGKYAPSSTLGSPPEQNGKTKTEPSAALPSNPKPI